MRLLVVRRAERLSVKGRSTVVISLGGRTVERGLRDIDAIMVIGSKVLIESSLPPVLAFHNIPLTVLSMDSIAILYNPVATRYNNYRRLQYTIDKCKALTIALEYIKSRISGMENVLKYLRAEHLVPHIPEPPERCEEPDTFEDRVRSWEAVSSHALWSGLARVIDGKVLKELKTRYGFSGRKPRHPDPFNKTLSVMYATLYSLGTKALAAAGLDPTYGFLHKARYSTPLTFDYIEMFKPIAIQATIELVNTQGLPELGPDKELTREWVNRSIKQLYSYLTLKHRRTGKTPYQQIMLKAYTLARHLEGKAGLPALTITWNRSEYRKPKTV